MSWDDWRSLGFISKVLWGKKEEEEEGGGEGGEGKGREEGGMGEEGEEEGMWEGRGKRGREKREVFGLRPLTAEGEGK